MELKVSRLIETKIWWTVIVLVLMTMVENVSTLSGPNVCMVQQKYNITKRVKYRAPMSVRTYEWCFAMPPRCSKWNTEMRDVTRLETEERTADMAVCCPGYKLKDVSCVPNCPSGKTGQGCLEDCPPKKWGPSCAHDCKQCVHGSCDTITGKCRCHDGWQGESCETSMKTTTAAALMEQLLTTETLSTKTTTQPTPTFITKSSTKIAFTNSGITNHTASSNIKSTIKTTPFEKNSLSYKDIIEPTIATIPETKGTLLATINTEKSTTSFTKPEIPKFSNETLPTIPMIAKINNKTAVYREKTQKNTNNSNYNRTELPSGKAQEKTSLRKDNDIESTSRYEEIDVTTLAAPANIPRKTIESIYYNNITSSISPFTNSTIINTEIIKYVTTSKQPITTKHKPKEIWIKPAQKGESPMIEEKIKPNHELFNSKFKPKEVVEITTPKTIIVSIIPTSVTYVTFKNIYLTTASVMAQKPNISLGYHNNRTAYQEPIRPLLVTTTSLPFKVKVPKKSNILSNHSLLLQNVTKANSNDVSTTGGSFWTAIPTTQITHSMLNVSHKRMNSSLLTTSFMFSTNVTKSTRKLHSMFELTTSKPLYNALSKNKSSDVTEKKYTVQDQNTVGRMKNSVTKQPKVIKKNNQKQSETNTIRNSTIANATMHNFNENSTQDEEIFPILTEPEHITAVMGDKEKERTTYNLISVISIAGGIMMVIITVAIVIVMLERCRRPRYEDVRKYNDIRMQVMIDNNDVPPPYVRSIFHTPLPDPPTSEKCHYQPISTLDRNLKQFMRPVVVQTISPLMLENFRGILECHYDHLPRRSQDMGNLQIRCSMAPSIDEREELLPPPRLHSLTDSDIDALKCEAKLDVIDNTTSEPLYAEIPCWRPPSAHAVEVVNLNGEAVTEL